MSHIPSSAAFWGLADKLRNASNENIALDRLEKEQNLSSLPNQSTTISGDEQTNVTGLSRASLRERIRKATRQIEAEIIMEALEQNRWNRRRTAESLRISYRSLMYKMKNCHLRDNGSASQPAGD